MLYLLCFSDLLCEMFSTQNEVWLVSVTFTTGDLLKKIGGYEYFQKKNPKERAPDRNPFDSPKQGDVKTNEWSYKKLT